MQFSDLSALSLSELKALATSHNAIPTGDKRAKQTWIDALELAAAATTITELSDAEMERVAITVDMATAAESNDVAVTDYVDMAETPTQTETPTPIAHKKGAASVFAALLCLLILTIQAVLTIGSAALQIAIHLKNLFGAYNPDYDMFGRLQDLVRSRSIVPVEQS